MENYIGVGRCLICRRATLENSPIDPENLPSNASLLLGFLYCFHVNVLDSKVHDLSRTCQFCQTCEQFVAEWSSIQIQLTQLTRRAVQLKTTLSARLLSTTHIPVQTYGDDVSETINNRIHKSPEVELALLLQQTVDDIRNQLHKKYSVNVMVDKIPLPWTPSKLNQEELDPLSGHCDNDDEPVDDWRVEDESDAEYLPSEDHTDDEETTRQILETRNKTKEKAHSDFFDGHDSAEIKERKVNRKSKTQTKVKRTVQTDGVPKRKRKPRRSAAIIPDGPNGFKYKGVSFQRNEEDQTYTCDACGFRSLPKMRSMTGHILLSHLALRTKYEKAPKCVKAVIPDGPNTFKYNGHGLRLNDEDECYYCGACDFKGTSNINSILVHIRELHYTEEDKQKFTAVKISNTEWIYGGKYKIIKFNETHKCVACGCVSLELKRLYGHIRTEHMNSEGPDAVPLPVSDAPSVFDSTPTQGMYKSVPYTFYPADNNYTCGICQTQVSNSRPNFGRHVKEHHTDAALSVVCEVCGKKLGNQSSYRRHLNKHRTEPKICPTCNKKFYCSKSFNQHLKLHVFGDALKKYQCEYCGKKFLQHQHCKAHVMIHTGEKPYACQDCGQKFRLTSMLSKHRQSAHGAVPLVRNLIRLNDGQAS